jgi:uncharacterized protein
MVPGPVGTVFTLPGYTNAGPEHWLSYWERAWTQVRRVEQDDWNAPERNAWVARLEATLNPAIVPPPRGQPVVLAAHSLGCLLLAHWCAVTAHPNRVAGPLLVAPPDLARPGSPATLESFAPAPLARLPFPTILVSSANDPWCTPDVAAALAEAWGSRHVDAGAAGHLDSAAGFGAWAAGWALLSSLLPPAPHPPDAASAPDDTPAAPRHR